MLAPLGMVFFLSFKINSMSVTTARNTFLAYSALMGLSLASIFAVYTAESIARTFFISASMFLTMSLYGYTTKKDLSGMGSFMMMGLYGIIIASVVNLFLGSTQLQFVVSILGVIIFTGLTAWDTQKIKLMYNGSDSKTINNKKALMSALTLYLDFINLFIMMLRLFGERR